MAGCGRISGSASTSDAFWMNNSGLHSLSKSSYVSNYKVFRNIKTQYGAVGDGVADVNFNGIAVIDADPYFLGVSNPDGSGINWWTTRITSSALSETLLQKSRGCRLINMGPATSIINVDFKMYKASSTHHQGIYMENGSGGFMSDLTFDGGAFGMWISNQQFTIRNVKITNAVSAIYQLWNWGFTWQNIQISNCQVGFDLHTGGLTLDTQSAAGVLIVDSKISSTGIGIRFSTSQPSSLAGSIVLDNVAFSGITTANIQDSSGTVLAANAAPVGKWFQGNLYLGSSSRYLRGSYTSGGTGRPAALVDSNGNFFTRSRPQYQTFKDTQFQSLMAAGVGAKGDGVSDDTAAINAFIAQSSGCAILLFEAGTYLVTDTIYVPPGTMIVGDMFSTIIASGSKFTDQNNPRPVIRVGNPGDIGDVETSDMVITTQGGSAGAICIEWNVRGSDNLKGTAGLWDVHIRLGGTKGTKINSANCPTT
ncbi:Glucan 1,3-beta-glucosidase [Mycena venus]|uniref:Glucan 1,3-beta-glucosidase n=1 Tax=Mycena venus TaxID=2733690 RepID=A0A8H6YWP3_9AGAR|nr:Glucan 1,3-beta-glucosidase [Mycena venus]